MNKFVFAAMLVAMSGAPVFAQTQPKPANAHARPAQPAAVASPMPTDEETESFAAYPDTGYGNVVVNGVVVGRDPDARIRLQLMRDPTNNPY